MNSKLASLLCCLIMLVSFSGCTKVTQLVKDAQPTKAELLAEINEEHRRYEGGSSDPTPYTDHDTLKEAEEDALTGLVEQVQ